MKFIKVFDTDAEYESFRDGDKYAKPNVSYSRNAKEVHYNYPIWDANGKSFVDLGLPSGTLWATMNVGASKPSDYGLYFQWGDTIGYTSSQVGAGSGQKKFAWADYKWNPSGDGKTFTKYTTTGATLELEDDAANKNMGGNWHMPTPDQIRELTNNTTSDLTASDDGVSGMTFTSKKDPSKFIFIPAAGCAKNGLLEYGGSDGYIWSSMQNANETVGGVGFVFVSPGAGYQINSELRYKGLSVRGVLG